MTTAAQRLEGAVIADEWQILRTPRVRPRQYKGSFTLGYFARHVGTGQLAFLKVLDLQRLTRLTRGVSATLLELETSAFGHEIHLLQLCKRRGLAHVVQPLLSGVIDRDGSVIDFLLCERAEGDAEFMLADHPREGLDWKVRALRDAALGLAELHHNGIAHQDVKAGNLLIFEGPIFKLGDLGRSTMKGIRSPYDSFSAPGDENAAPPESLYGLVTEDRESRTFAGDMYQFGALIYELVCSQALTRTVIGHLEPDKTPDNWKGGYHALLPWLRPAFKQALQAIVAQAPCGGSRALEVLSRLVEDLCDPCLETRHFSPLGTLESPDTAIGLERYATLLERCEHAL